MLKKTFGVLLAVFLLLVVGCSNDSESGSKVERGKEAIINEEYEKALVSFESALEEKSDDAEVNVLIEQTEKMIDAIDEEEANNIEDAIALFEEVENMEGGYDRLSEQAKERREVLVAQVEEQESEEETAQQSEKEESAGEETTTKSKEENSNSAATAKADSYYVEEVVSGMINGLEQASYNEDPSYLTAYINPNSSFYQEQIDLINGYSEKGITVEVINHSIDDMELNDDGSYTVSTTEEYKIHKNGEESNLKQSATYKVEYIGGEYLVSSMELEETATTESTEESSFTAEQAIEILKAYLLETEGYNIDDYENEWLAADLSAKPESENGKLFHRVLLRFYSPDTGTESTATIYKVFEDGTIADGYE